MRAAVLEEAGRPLAIWSDVEIEEPHTGEVVVRIAHCGVCHSDLSIIDGVFPAPVPVIAGHEASGVVEAVGPGVTLVEPGDPVVLTPCPPCGHCYYCQRGEFSICVNSLGIVTNTLPDGGTRLSRAGEVVYRGVGVGAFGERVVIQETGVVPIPVDVPLEIACVIGCAVQTGVGAVINTARVEPGASVLVMGLGGVGLSIVQGARLAGAGRIVVSDPVPDRREAASRFGATDLVDPTSDDVVAATIELTGGIGADYAFDAAGRGALIAAGINATRSGGTTVVVGAPPLEETAVIDPVALFTLSEKHLIGCCLGGSNSLRDIPRLIRLWQTGQLDLGGLVTARRPLDEINEALDDLRAARGIRTVLDL